MLKQKIRSCIITRLEVLPINSVLVSAHTYLWIRGRPKTTKHMADRIRIVWETSSRRAVARNDKKAESF